MKNRSLKKAFFNAALPLFFVFAFSTAASSQTFHPDLDPAYQKNIYHKNPENLSIQIMPVDSLREEFNDDGKPSGYSGYYGNYKYGSKGVFYSGRRFSVIPKKGDDEVGNISEIAKIEFEPYPEGMTREQAFDQGFRTPRYIGGSMPEELPSPPLEL